MYTYVNNKCQSSHKEEKNITTSNKETNKPTSKQKTKENKQTNKQTNRQTDRQTNRHTNIQKTQTNKPTSQPTITTTTAAATTTTTRKNKRNGYLELSTILHKSKPTQWTLQLKRNLPSKTLPALCLRGIDTFAHVHRDTCVSQRRQPATKWTPNWIKDHTWI